LFKGNTQAADAYHSLFHEDVWNGWIEKQLIEVLSFLLLSSLDIFM
jgi:hypothetical protein